MKILKSLSIFSFLLLFTGCINNQVVTIPIKYSNPLTLKEKKVDILFTLNEKEKEFIKILEEDKYASLCNYKTKYEKIKQLNNKSEVSKELENLFYAYTVNLANSCIKQDSLKKALSKNKTQHYEFYNENIDKKDLLAKYKNKKISVKEILDEYKPNHPNFFKLIKESKNSKLTSSEQYKIRLNIERLKLIKYYESSNFIQLNVPSYNFSFYEEGKNVKEFGTIVGKKEKQTPILSSKVSHFIINPTWNIPDSIAKKSIIPKALKDKNYLKKKNIVIRKDYKLDSKKIAFKDVNWKKYLKDDVKYIPYKFIQLPSKTNGMGRVKFMFANDYSVYMHDTIGTWRFKINKESIRSVSSGCVRLEHPRALMKYITKKYTPKTYQSVRKTFFEDKTDIINLTKRLPVHITYLTAYTKNGKVKFYKDIYGYDKIQKLNFNPNS